MFARKPAPVQVTYLAYCSTTGLETIDYRISDPHLDPVEIDDRELYSETTVRLPASYWCYAPPADAPEVPPRHGRDAEITFGCLNNFAKVSRLPLETWLRILQQVPGSHLILHAPSGSHRQNTLNLFASGGVDPGRIEFFGMLPQVEYLNLASRIDIALDPFPYNGGTTSCDMLWMGAPLITLRGKTAVGRGGASILMNIGLAELIAQNTDQYVELATDLASDIPRLANLRSSLRQRMRNSPLMDAPKFARDVETCYRKMWMNWCERGQSAAS
jgi:predicted O-linked N-acetylglucosamine transferase (SPINDLY family)